MSKNVLISCVSQKLEHKAKAEKLYTSSLFKYNLQYAKSLNADRIFILSAKYGLLNLEDEIEPYDLTLNNMGTDEIKTWAKNVLSQLKKTTDLKNDQFVFLAGDKYRRYLLFHISNYELPLKGMRIGEQLQYLKEHVKNKEKCGRLHQWFGELERMFFSFDEDKIPKNGIYILFEKGEHGHSTDRIVRIGTHTGKDQLRSRLKQHFINENKDRSIFRKNIGRALLNKDNDPFLEQWELGLMTREEKEKYSDLVNPEKLAIIEQRVSRYIQDNFSFVVFEVNDKDRRMELESKLISTVSLCTDCKHSVNWLGSHSPKKKIRDSGLWLVNSLYKEPLSEKEMEELKSILS